MGCMTGMGGKVQRVCIFQAGCRLEKFQFSASAKGVEVSRHNHRFGAVFDQTVQMFQLLLSMPVFQGKVDDKDNNLRKFNFNNQSFKSLIEVMKVMGCYCFPGEQGIGLFIQNRDPSCQGIVRVFCFNNMELMQFFSNDIGLTASVGTIGARIHLDEGNDVRLNRFDEIDDMVQGVGRMSEESGKRQRQMVSHTLSGGITDVVEKEAHGLYDTG